MCSSPKKAITTHVSTELSKRYLWAPYASARNFEERTLINIVRAEGPYLHDDSNKTYFDCNASWWCKTLGHQHPSLVAALEEGIKHSHIAAAGLTHPALGELACKISEWMPKHGTASPLTRCHFTENGSSAVEAALKMAFQYWQIKGQQNNRETRKEFISLASAYHGDTLGAMGLGRGNEFFQSYTPLFAPGTTIDHTNLTALKTLLESRAKDVAAVIVEPLVLGASGMQMYPASLLQHIRELCTEHNVLLIVDEIFTGFYRTGATPSGKGWACDHAGITPDIICIGKGLTAGTIPLACAVASEHIYQTFGDTMLMSGHTYFGYTLGAHVALGALEVYTTQPFLDSVDRVTQALKALSTEIPHARSLGGIFAVDLNTRSYHGDAGWRLYETALNHGLYLRPLGNTVYLTPPLWLSPDDLNFLLERFRKVMLSL